MFTVDEKLIEILDKDLEFEVPKEFIEFNCWFMKGKPDPTNKGKFLYYASNDTLMGDGRTNLLNYYKRVQSNG